MKIVIGGLHTECASTSPLAQSAADFTRTSGAELLAMTGVDWAGAGARAVPLFHDRSVPGGPVPRALYEAQCEALIAAIRAEGPVEGVLLLLHGALFVPGVDDPEGALIARVRAAVGPEALLAASFDLHGQITAQITDTLDIFAAYRTAPHIDVRQTHARAGAMLLRALRGGARPQVVRVPVPVLVSGEMSATTAPPCAGLYGALPSYESAEVWDANLMVGYVWADSPRATACAVVTCTAAEAGAKAASAIAQSYWDQRRALICPGSTGTLAQMLAHLRADPTPGTAILADSGDNPTAGGVGDRADALAAVLEMVGGTAPGAHIGTAPGAHTAPAPGAHTGTPPGAPTVLIAGLTAPRACAALAQGAQELYLGNDLGGGGPVVPLRPESATRYGEDWVVRQGPLTVALTARRRPFHTLAQFAALGLAPDQAALLVVKSGYLSPMLAELPGPRAMALSPGAVSQDLLALPNHHRPRPCWPFQTDFTWEAPCRS